MNNLDKILPLSESHITAIGRVTAYFSLLENHANALISDLLELKTREDTISITARMTFSNKIQLIKTLASAKLKDNAELTDVLNETVADMEHANEKRNLIVHANWYYHSSGSNESGILRQKTRGKIKTSLEGFTPERINEVAVLILKRLGKFSNFY